MYDLKEVNRISKNLSLRLSPERKYKPNCCCSTCCCHPCKCCLICHCLPCRCCHDCHLYPCCCYHYVPRFKNYSPIKTCNDFEDDIIKKPNEIPKPLRTSSLDIRYKNHNSDYKPRNFDIKVYNTNAYEQVQFNEFLKKLMEVESKIENAKIALALQTDFNCEDAFRIFELNDRGYLEKEDIKYGLSTIGINPNDHELRLFMNRFDLQKQDAINYADFFDILVPFEKEYRTMVENRPPNSCCPSGSPDIFSYGTVFIIKDLFNLLINAEKQINEMRRGFGTLRLKLRHLFGLVDEDKKGYFLNEDLVNYLKRENIFSKGKDADLLYIRLDKNRNGKIDFSELEDEVKTVY